MNFIQSLFLSLLRGLHLSIIKSKRRAAAGRLDSNPSTSKHSVEASQPSDDYKVATKTIFMLTSVYRVPNLPSFAMELNKLMKSISIAFKVKVNFFENFYKTNLMEFAFINVFSYNVYILFNSAAKHFVFLSITVEKRC